MSPQWHGQATTAWSNCPVNFVRLGMKTTECRTLALALEIDVPITKKLAKEREKSSRASLTSERERLPIPRGGLLECI